MRKLETAGRRVLERFVFSNMRPDHIHSRIPAGTDLGRILLMRWDAIGDMMLSLPLFRRVRDLWPDAEVGIVVSERNRSLLKYEEGFTTFLYSSRPGLYLKSMKQVLKFSADAVVDTRMHYDSNTSFIYALLSKAPWTLSAANRDNRLPFSVRVPLPCERHHVAELLRILLEGLGRDIDDRDLDRAPRLSREEEEFAAGFWRETGLRNRGRCTGVNLSARDPNHRWREEEYVKLCIGLISSGRRPLLIYAPDDRPYAIKIAHQVQGILVAPRCPTILHAAALVRDLAALVTPDTGMVHLAASMDVPIVGLYCPNEEHLPLWHPWKVRHRLVQDPDKVGNITHESVLEALDHLVPSDGQGNWIP